MKSIKLKVVMWLIILMGMTNICPAQEDTIISDTSMTPKDTNVFHHVFDPIPIDITAEPVEFTLNSEPLKDNEALQTMLELETEQTDALNQNLSSLNQIIGDLPYVNVEAKADLLDYYNVNLEKTNDNKRNIYIFWYSFLVVFWLLCLCWVLFSDNLYYSRRQRWMDTTVMIITSALLGIILPTVHCIIAIESYYLPDLIDKLF